MRFHFFIVFFILGLAVNIHHAQAQRQARSFSAAKPLPQIAFMSEDDFKSQTKLVRNKSPSDEFLAYEIRVPNNWTEIEQDNDSLSLSMKLLNTLVVYRSPLGQYNKKSEIQVQAIELPTSVTPERWLLEYILSLGYHVEYMGIYSSSRAEAMIAYIEKGQSFVERFVVEINGRRALLTSYTMPIEAWSEYKTLQAQVLDSFKALNEFEGDVENFNRHAFLDIAEMRYPLDWTLRAKPPENVDRIDANILNVPNLNQDLREVNEINGRIEVSLVSIYGTQSLSIELENQRAVFEKDGFVYEEQNEITMPSSYFINPAFELADIKAYVTPPTGRRTLEKELWFATLAAGDYYYFVKMLTPSRKSDYYLWLRNAEVFKTVLEGLKPLPNPEVIEPPPYIKK